MSKKDFIALADAIKSHEYNARIMNQHYNGFSRDQIEMLADFCQSTNPRFNRERWLAYIAGECGPNGGRVKKAA